MELLKKTRTHFTTKQSPLLYQADLPACIPLVLRLEHRMRFLHSTVVRAQPITNAGNAAVFEAPSPALSRSDLRSVNISFNRIFRHNSTVQVHKKKCARALCVCGCAGIYTSRCPGFFPGHASFAYFFLRGPDSENTVGVVEATSCMVFAHKLAFGTATCDSNASRGFSTGGAVE